MNVTNEMIISDIKEILLGEKLFLYLNILCGVFLLGVTVWMLIIVLKKKDPKITMKNVLCVGLISLFGLSISLSYNTYKISALKMNIEKHNWTACLDKPVEKYSSATPNVNDYKIKYENQGLVKVTEKQYKNSKIGVSDYIVFLGNGDKLIYSSN